MKKKFKKPIVTVSKDKIVQKAVSIVSKTKSTLVVTMFLREEKGKVPKIYKNTLSKALDRGVFVHRICFGSSKEFEEYSKSFDKRVKLSLIKNISGFQRMIISDSSAVLFRMNSDCYCLSESVLVVRVFSDYINLLL